MTRPVALALSPHLDDAAFSCGGALAMLAASGWRVVVATLFTRSVPNPSGFALACQLDKGLAPEVDYMTLRRDEDRAAMAVLRAEPIWLDFAEAPHRGYESAAALFADPVRHDAVVAELSSAMGRLRTDLAPGLVLAPQAIGGHVDHVQVVRALEAIEWRAPILWWRDFPYAVRGAHPCEPFRRPMENLPDMPIVLDPHGAAAKRAACLAYGSQIGFQFGGSERLDAALAATRATEHVRLQGTFPQDIELKFGRGAAA